MKIAFFGGSFDPPHLGHKKIIEYCISFFDKVLIVPNKESVESDKKNTASAEDRINMLNSMLNSKSVEVIDFEIKSDKRNFTYYTIKYLEQQYPNEELFMIIGKDQMCNLYNWYKYDYIFNNINIVCFDRKTDMHHEEYSLSDYKKKVDYIDFNYRSSSSDIKNKLLDFKNNKDLSLELLCLLDENVLEYIIKNKLYI